MKTASVGQDILHFSLCILHLLQAPQHTIPSRTTVVLPGDRRAFLFGQRWQDLSVIFIYLCGLLRGGSLPPGPQPLRYELNYARHDVLSLLLMVKVACQP